MKTAFLFPGQGSQYVGMGKSLYQDFKLAQLLFEEANDIVGFDLKKLCFEGDSNELTQTQNAQPAIFVVSYMALRILSEETGIKPDYCAGHSLGEFTALACGEALQFKDGVKIVRKRGEFMNNSLSANIGTMAAIEGLNYVLVDEMCKIITTKEKIVEISCLNAREQIVVSGHHEAIQALKERVIQSNAKFTLLRVSAPFHCSLMGKAAIMLNSELLNYHFQAPKTAVISNVTALPYQNVDEIIHNLTLQMTNPVRWYDTIEYFKNEGVNTFYEVGPQKVLSKFLKGSTSNSNIHTFGLSNELPNIKQSLSFNYQYNLVDYCLSEAICIKNYNFIEEDYLHGVIEPYQQVKKIKEHLDGKNVKPSEEQMLEAVNMLKKIMTTKKTPHAEQQARLGKIKKLFSENLGLMTKKYLLLND